MFGFTTGKLDFARVARLTAQVCGSVAEAHRLGIVHRDIKPENIMIVTRPDQGESAKVLDFGLAKLRDTQAGNTVTRAGAIVGTPYYMPPEQIRGEDVDPRGDVYAIGAMMYEALSGRTPFIGETASAIVREVMEHVLPFDVRQGPCRGQRIPLLVNLGVGRTWGEAH